MLEYSKTILNLNNTTFIHEDFTKINLNKKFDLITAFRFFPNAEPFLRNKEIKELVKTNNLKIYQYKSVGLITNKEKSLVMPWSIISKLENFLFKIYSNHLIGYNVIYLIGR